MKRIRNRKVYKEQPLTTTMAQTIKRYGKPTITQKIQRYFVPKVWYEVYAPLHEGTHEEEQ